MKTRYVIIEPETRYDIKGEFVAGPWIDVEFKDDKPTLPELCRILDPLFGKGQLLGWERVAVNWSQGAADMFVGEHSARDDVPINEPATLIYWTASEMHKAAERLPLAGSYAEIRQAALREAADRFTISPRFTGPRIHGRAVLFADEVWS